MKAKIRNFIEGRLDYAKTVDPSWHWHLNKVKKHPIYYLYMDRFECNFTINPYLITVEVDNKNISMTYEDYINGKRSIISCNYHNYEFKNIKLLICYGFGFFRCMYTHDYSNEWWMNPK